MKKSIAKQLNQFATELPKVYVTENIVIQELGYWLNRSFYGEFQEFEDDKFYEIPFIQLRAVEHKQQLKDAVKKLGAKGITNYCNNLMKKVKK